MKINVKTDPETLFLIHRLIRDECQVHASGRLRRSGKSMRLELFTQLSQRCINYSCNPNGKKMNLTLKYHLANELLDIVTSVIVHRTLGTFEHNKMEIFKNELHQKLL